MDMYGRRQIEMALRVRDFIRAHPSDDPGYATLVARLELATAKAENLAQQQRLGLIEAKSAVKSQQALSTKLLRRLLKYLGRVGDAAAVKYPELTDRFTAPSGHTPLSALGTIARAQLNTAKANEAQLKEFGMVTTLLPELETVVASLELVSEQRNAGRRAHISARTGLTSLRNELRITVNLLDGLNRVRFAESPDELEAWNNAKAIIQPARRVTPPPAASPDASAAA
jgi:hypothetical protein